MRVLVVNGNKIEIDLVSLLSGKETIYHNGRLYLKRSRYGVVYTHSQLKRMEWMLSMK